MTQYTAQSLTAAYTRPLSAIVRQLNGAGVYAAVSWGRDQLASVWLEKYGEIEADRPARRDGLPEHADYADVGCSVHPSCLNCPLVRCRYDDPGGPGASLRDARDHEIAQAYHRGATVDALASQFGVSRRTVFRAIGRRAAGGKR